MDIVERLRFDATRCEVQFSKGVATNIEEAAAKIEKLRAALSQIAGKNDLEGVEPDATASAAYAALHECEIIARDALGEAKRTTP